MSKLTSKPKTTPKGQPRDPRRRDQRDAPPDSLPRSSEDIPIAGYSAAPDGGVAQHPIHDEPEEDFTPRDYERQIDEVADELRAKARRAGVKSTDKVSEER
jgi:hypothetical protein